MSALSGERTLLKTRPRSEIDPQQTSVIQMPPLRQNGR
jgi:hypothetical protein